MTRCHSLAAIVGIALTLGCESHRSDARLPGDAASTSTIDGHYVFGAEVNTFSPCATNNAYWVIGDSAKTASLRAAYIEWSTATHAEPYAPMFARLHGSISSGPLDGFAEAYDGLFTVEAIALMRGIEEGDCRPLSSR
jgi:hypothetical protein